MKGDFSRNPYDPSADLTRILFQQGKPLVEADLNEGFSAVQAQFRDLIHWLRHGAASPHGAVGEGFALKVPVVGSPPEVTVGNYLIDDLFFHNPATQSAAEYTSLNANRYVMRFKANGGTQLTSKSFVVALAAIERPLLLTEIFQRSSRLGELRTGLPCRTDWRIILDPFDDTIPLDVFRVRNALLCANALPLPSPFPPGPQAFSETTLTLEILQTNITELQQGRMWRLEVHQTDSTNNRVMLKLAIDNAAQVYGARVSHSGNIQLARYAGELPQRNEYIEFESDESWLRDPGELHEVTSSLEVDHGVISKSATIVSEFKDGGQARRWNWQSEVFIDDVIKTDGIPLGPLQLRFDAADDVAAREFRRGDSWTFTLGKNVAASTKISGSRQRSYFIPLGVLKFAADGTATVEHADFRLEAPPIDEIATLSPAPFLERQPVPVTRLAVAFAHATSCRGLAMNVQSLAAKRWLASVTLGEIAALSKEQLRQRIERDSLPKELDPPLLERDLNEIVARRQQVLSLQSIA